MARTSWDSTAQAQSDSSSAEKKSLAFGNFRKTRTCRYFAVGQCNYGAACNFAHGRKDLKVPKSLAKTSLCKLFLAGKCAHSSEDCLFAHSKKEMRRVLPDEEDTMPIGSFLPQPAAPGCEQSQSMGGTLKPDPPTCDQSQKQQWGKNPEKKAQKPDWIRPRTSHCFVQSAADQALFVNVSPEAQRSAWNQCGTSPTEPAACKPVIEAPAWPQCEAPARESALPLSTHPHGRPQTDRAAPLPVRDNILFKQTDRAAPLPVRDNILFKQADRTTLPAAIGLLEASMTTLPPCIRSIGGLEVFSWQNRTYIGNAAEILRKAEPECYED